MKGLARIYGIVISNIMDKLEDPSEGMEVSSREKNGRAPRSMNGMKNLLDGKFLTHEERLCEACF